MNSTRETEDSRESDTDRAFNEAASRATAYIRRAPDRQVAPAAEALEKLRDFDTPLPESPLAATDVVAQLDQIGSPATVTTTGGRYFGFVNGGALPASVAASWLAAAWDQNVALRVMSPVGAALEDVALRWVRELLLLPEACGGALVTGATMANFAGLAAARRAVLAGAGWDVERHGLFGAPPMRVIVGDEVHVSVLKALGLLGLGRSRVERVPIDRQGRICAASMPPFDDRTIVCIQAGNVNTGAFDPAREICRRARDAGAWVHVDGAFGLWARASPVYRHLTDGFELADSWSADAHKWPNSVYDCGIAMVRRAPDLQSAMALTSAYFTAGATREPSQFSPEMSRRARGVELWATLRSLGRSGLAGLIERTCAHARHFADALAAAGFEILNDVVINQVLVSFGSSETTRDVIARVQQDGTCWCGGTEWQGRTAMRISVSSWATTDADVDLSVEAIVRAAKAASAG